MVLFPRHGILLPRAMRSLLIKNGTIMSPEGELNADVIIKGGRIQKILKRPYEPGLISQMGVKFSEECDISGKIVFPGLIDCHVHFREPGLEHKETMETGAAAALAGGVTTVCEMPNTIPPTVTVAALADKVRRSCGINSASYCAPGRRLKPAATSGDLAAGSSCGRPSRALGGSFVGLSISRLFQSSANGESATPEFIPVDIRFFFGATEQAHLAEFKKLFTDPSHAHLKERCCGLKLYFDHSTGNQGADMCVIEEAFKLCSELGMPIVCHCEDAEINRMQNEKLKMQNDIFAHSQLRPAESEEKAVEDAIVLAEKHGTRLHIAHLSTKGGLNLVRKAKADGIAVTCEVAPHHLFLTVEDYATLGTLAKMNPPLRTREHQEALWEGIADGTVDCIATDHAPHTLEEKMRNGAESHGSTGLTTGGSPLLASSGAPGVETMLPLLLSVASGRWPHQEQVFSIINSQFSILHILRLCFVNPNHIFNLEKQGIKEGAPADMIVVDPKKQWTIKGSALHSKCGWSPYEGWKVFGKIIKIIS